MIEPTSFLLFSSAMSDLQSKYARVVVRHDDPRDLEFKFTNRSFRIEIFHRFNEKDPESPIEDFLIEGTMGDMIHLLETLRVTRMKSASEPLSAVRKLLIHAVPFSVEDTIEHLKTKPNPLTFFVTDTTRDEILERLQLWRKERDEDKYGSS